MVQKFVKFIKRSPHRNLFEKVLQDILDNNLDSYDIKELIGKKWYYRLRAWSVRFIFKKTPHSNILIRVNNRWDVYKWF